MALDQLGQFMNAIGTIESGNNYNAVGPQTASYGRAQGRYQIMSEIYPGWAREAGVDPNDLSPAAQDRVASFKMRQYYERFGRWDLVAVAWFAGPGRAERAARDGISSLSGIKDVLGTDVATYAQKAMAAMGNTSSSEPRNVEHPGGPTIPEPSVGGSTSPTGVMVEGGVPQVDPDQQFEREAELNQNTIGAIMSAVSSAASRGGGQILDKQAMFGDIFTRVNGVD